MKVPQTDLGERLRPLLAPLVERFGDHPSEDEVAAALALVAAFWNARLLATGYWGRKQVKDLSEVRKRLDANGPLSDGVSPSDRLETIWRETSAAFDPRLVVEARHEGAHGLPSRIICTWKLPPNTYAMEEPALETRVCIGGRFLDETLISTSATTQLRFPATEHRADVHADGNVTVRTKAAAAVALFAAGVVPPVGSSTVELIVLGQIHKGMCLAGVLSVGPRDGDVELVFAPAGTGQA